MYFIDVYRWGGVLSQILAVFVYVYVHQGQIVRK